MPLFPRLLLFASLSLDLRVGADGVVSLGGKAVDCTADPPKGAQPTRLVLADGAPGSALSCALGLVGTTVDYDVAWEGSSPGTTTRLGYTMGEIDAGALHVLLGTDRVALWRDDPARAVVLPDVDGDAQTAALIDLLLADFRLNRQGDVLLDWRRSLPGRAGGQFYKLLALETRGGTLLRGEAGPLPDPPARPLPGSVRTAASFRVDTHANLLLVGVDGTQRLIPYTSLAGFERVYEAERCILVARAATGEGWALGWEGAQIWNAEATYLMGKPVWPGAELIDPVGLPALPADAFPLLPWGERSGDAPVIVPISRRSDIDREIKAHLPDFRNCYERVLGRKPALKGTVTVGAVIARDGSVASVKIKASTLEDEEVESCVMGRFMMLSFPPTSDGRALFFSYPFLFST